MAFIYSEENSTGLLHVKFRLVLFSIVSKAHYIGVSWLPVCVVDLSNGGKFIMNRCVCVCK